ncbi:MAG TPA: MarR family winged helix-turn-helix transcriptional regulator [Anaeromyxobacteraceae bacterium]|nr:MarR family winged helix-turn-helix transcriptional regulator [Anaeromyxobacteraceae bacterium]
MSIPLEELLDQVRLLWHVAVQAGERLHQGEAVTLGGRAVLEFLEANGPTTVPEVARRRHVTRQHIQALVNVLLDLGLVALDVNPAHRRSALVRLTAEGERAIARMRKRERRLLEGLAVRASQEELRRAAAVLAEVRGALGGRP